MDYTALNVLPKINAYSSVALKIKKNITNPLSRSYIQ